MGLQGMAGSAMSLTFLLRLLSVTGTLSQTSPWANNTWVKITSDIVKGHNLSNCWVCHDQPTGGSQEYLWLEGHPVNESIWLQHPIFRANKSFPSPVLRIQPIPIDKGECGTGIPGGPKCLVVSSLLRTSNLDPRLNSTCSKDQDCYNSFQHKVLPITPSLGKRKIYSFSYYPGCQPDPDEYDYYDEYDLDGDECASALWQDSLILDPFHWIPRNHTHLGVENHMSYPGKLCLKKGLMFLGLDPQSHGIATQCLDTNTTLGMWTVGYVIPSPKNVHLYSNLSTTEESQAKAHQRNKRELELINLGVSLLGGSLINLTGDIIYNAMVAQNITNAIADLAQETGQDFQLLQKSLDSLPKMVLDHRIALDYLLAEQGGVCALANTSCCFYVNTISQVETSIKIILDHATWLRSEVRGQPAADIWNTMKQAIPSFTWFLPFLGSLVAILLLLIFRPCVLNCLTFSVSKRIEAIKLQMIITQGYEQLGLQAADNQMDLKVARENFCSSSGPHDDIHVQQEATTEARTPALNVPQE
ncbi:endogenous retrovirus group V member 2 Env polyprotein-like [Choloepus didactylus]|uniref:endogenous retrovirus group V member 2 Env polyprotein-like n=1 Tax=Choloepus didactylus TaxID=27675 RepID=UPI00189CE682|nr:endogenous retrovirus group V member 2 Env polyprotein-like [Choloepus didactylus]